jgi:hypothetical protein
MSRVSVLVIIDHRVARTSGSRIASQVLLGMTNILSRYVCRLAMCGPAVPLSIASRHLWLLEGSWQVCVVGLFRDMQRKVSHVHQAHLVFSASRGGSGLGMW